MLDVSEVTKIYGSGQAAFKALDGVSLSVKRGARVCIMGKSGSGKSTLLRQMALIDRPTSGQITLSGQEVTHMPEWRRSRLRLANLGYVFQEFALLSELTAQENVYLPAMMLGSSRREYLKRSEELLEKVGLGHRLHNRPSALSGGEKQRVAIARAMVNQPSIIFADEPTANLDSRSTDIVMHTFVQLNEELGVTLVFVSHDPEHKNYANQLIYIKDGQITEPYL
jgi:putative ABC transport system ATP-binding protein